MFQPRLLHEVLLSSAAAFPDKTALIVDGNSYSYSELLEQSLALAAGLQQHGLKCGDRVVVFMDNSWPCVVAVYAILFAGGVFVIANAQTKSDKLRFIVRDSEAKFMLSDHLHSHIFLPVLKDLERLKWVIYAGEEIEVLPELRKKTKTQLAQFDDFLGNRQMEHEKADIISLDLAALIYTSGTTGRPKGVMQTHQAMIFTTGSIVEYLRLSAEHRILNVLPLAFDYGLYQLLMSIYLGATLVLEHSFTYPGHIYKRIKEEQITVFPGVPTIFSLLLASHSDKPLCFDSVTRVTNTAAKLPAAFLPRLKEIFPNGLVYKMYGLTECKRVSYLEPELIDRKPDSVGKPIPGTQVFLLTPDGKPVSPGENGILHVRGPHVMLGYWKKPEMSAEMLIELPGNLPNNLVLNTQDLFMMDEEGFLYFVGRTDDIIKSRGEKVSPVEVENVLHGIRGIREAAVIGIDDLEFGEAIHAFVSLDDGISLSEKDILRKCRLQLENFMVPQQIVILPELPKTNNGKIDKKALKAMESGSQHVN